MTVMLERTVNETQRSSPSRFVKTSLVKAVSTCQPKLSSSGSASLIESAETETRIEPSLRSKAA